MPLGSRLLGWRRAILGDVIGDIDAREQIAEAGEVRPVPADHAVGVRFQRRALEIGLDQVAGRHMIDEDAAHVVDQDLLCVLVHLDALGRIAGEAVGFLHQRVEVRIAPGVAATRYKDAEHVAGIQVVHAVGDEAKLDARGFGVERFHEGREVHVADFHLDAQILLERSGIGLGHRLGQRRFRAQGKRQFREAFPVGIAGVGQQLLAPSPRRKDRCP